jgi:hypothetical protein
MSWVQCPRCGSCRDRHEEACGCIVTACDACLLIEIDDTCCAITLAEWEKEMSGKDN